MTTTYDAGREREALARDLADWLMGGFWPSAKAQRWWRRVRRLARTVHYTVPGMVADLDADARAIMAEDE